MAERLVREVTPMEFFREQLVLAMEHQRVSTSAFTEYYLVNLLASGVQGESLPPAEPGYDETPLALLYARAVMASRIERARLLKLMGDTALFVAGFFSDSLAGKLVDFGYYRAMGGHAYTRLAREEGFACGPPVFSELADRFGQFADVLAEVSEQAHLTSNLSLVKLYERWLKTGSRRAAALLAQKGITPVAPHGEGGVQ